MVTNKKKREKAPPKGVFFIPKNKAEGKKPRFTPLQTPLYPALPSFKSKGRKPRSLIE